MNKEQSAFSAWWKSESSGYTFDYPSEAAEFAWYEQQEKIDKLEKEIAILKYRLVCFENDV